jgi:hypothetical protein
MSKPVAQVTFSALLGLVMIVGLSTNVQNKLSRVLAKTENGASAHVVNGVQTNFNHYRSSASVLNQLELQSDLQNQYQNDRPHGCESESNKTDPND